MTIYHKVYRVATLPTQHRVSSTIVERGERYSEKVHGGRSRLILVIVFLGEHPHTGEPIRVQVGTPLFFEFPLRLFQAQSTPPWFHPFPFQPELTMTTAYNIKFVEEASTCCLTLSTNLCTRHRGHVSPTCSCVIPFVPCFKLQAFNSINVAVHQVCCCRGVHISEMVMSCTMLPPFCLSR